MTQIHRSLLFTAVERYASLFLFLVSTAVLARLLTPLEFGVYAAVSAVTTVVSLSVQEFGGANYLIQKASLSRENVRSAFTIALSLSTTLGILIYLIAAPLGSWFGLAGVATGIKISALGFLIAPFSTTAVALLRRDLMFDRIAVANLISNVTMAAVSITLAYLGFSFLSPIWGQLAGVAAQIVYLLMACKDLQMFRFSLFGCKEILHFGLYSFGVTLINLVYISAPQLFLARMLGFTALGLYSRAVGVTQVFDRLVVQTISPVIMPAFVAQKRAGVDLKGLYLNSISLLTALQWPFLLVAALMAHPLIYVWLGPSWLATVPLVRLLCIGYLALFASCLTYPVLVALGGVRDALICSLISLPPSLALLFAASFVGVEAVAASALVALPFQGAVSIYFVARHLKFDRREFVVALRKSAFVAVASGAAAALGARAIDVDLLGPIAGLVLSGVLAGAAWFASLVAVDHPLFAALREAASGVKTLSLRPSARRPAPL